MDELGQKGGEMALIPGVNLNLTLLGFTGRNCSDSITERKQGRFREGRRDTGDEIQVPVQS
jgi:hypothetical protein